MKEFTRRTAGKHGHVQRSSTRWAAAAAAAGCAAWLSPAAEAYVGPGAGMGVLGVMLAVVAALFMALVGLVLWPIRMVAYRRKLKARESAADRRGADARGANRRNADPRGPDAPTESPTR